MLASSNFMTGSPIASGSMPVNITAAGMPKMTTGGRRRKTHCKKGGKSKKHRTSRKGGKSRKHRR